MTQLNSGRPILPCNDLDYTEIVPTIFREGGPGCDFKDSKKPEALLRFLIEICTRSGDVILDPYGGSGTTLAVAIKMKRFSALIENNQTSVAIIKQRINNLQTGEDLDGLRHQFDISDSINKFRVPEQESQGTDWLDPVRREGDLFDMTIA